MIATVKNQHLSDQDLIEFGFGRVPSERFEVMLKHLDECDQCQRRVCNSSLDDSFVKVLAVSALPSDDPVLTEADCQAAMFHAAQVRSGASPAMQLDAVMPPIESLGPYRLIRPLGRGGMGAVYLAEHVRLKKKCAIKLLPRGRGFDSLWVGRFDREMQAVAALSHPGIVNATDAGDVDGWHYLVMEYLDGLDLSSIVRRLGPIDVKVAAAIMRDVCKALAAVHDGGLIHRDIKPSNIMLTRDGCLKLLDLGLVLDQQQSIEDMRLTTVGQLVGTLAFAAPEQLSSGTTIDARADLYGIGATLFQLIAGRPAHEPSRGIAPLVIEKTSRTAIRLRSLVPDAPEEIDGLVAELLERDPDARPRSAIEVGERLDQIISLLPGKSSALKPLITRAMRVDDPDPMLADSLPVVGFANDGEPPNHHRWLKWLAAGGAAATILATIIITIQSGKSKVRIESDAAEMTVHVAEAETAEATTALPEKMFKGEPLSYWTNLLAIERDVDTLGDAINAVVSLVDPGDVDAAHAILVAARRYGGWVASADKGKPSQWYMTQFAERYGRIMPEPGIAAILKELPIGNQQSRAAALWVLSNFDYRSWANNPENRDSATALHRELLALASAGGSSSDRSQSVAQEISLTLALALDEPLEQEPGLREAIDHAIAEATKVRAIDQRFDNLWPDGFSDLSRMNDLSVEQSVAAQRLGIELPASLDARMLLDQSEPFQAQRNEWFIQRLSNDPKVYADEAVSYVLTAIPISSMTAEANPAGVIRRNESLWIEALPMIAEHTTRPDVLYYTLQRVVSRTQGDAGMTGMGGMGGGFGGSYVSEALGPVLVEVSKIIAPRVTRYIDAHKPAGNANDPFGDGSSGVNNALDPFGDQSLSPGGGGFQ